MAGRLLFDFKGLVTAPGRLARDGASCIDTQNVVFDAPGHVSKRRGFRRLNNVASGIPWKVFPSSSWGNQVVISRGTGTGATALQYGTGSVVWGNLAAPDAGTIVGTSVQRVMGAESLKSFFLAAKEAPMRLEPDALTNNIVRYAGMPRGLPADFFTTSPLNPGAGTLLPDGYARAYRVSWHRYDSDGVLLSGPPTSRFVARNQANTVGYIGATTRDARLRLQVPIEWGTNTTAFSSTIGYFYRLWANRTFNAVGGEEGDDEMYLVAEGSVTAGEITAGLVTAIVDSTPDDYLQRQLALNTNAINFPLGELGLAQGLLNADEAPPVAYEVSSWNDCVWWSDLRYRPRTVVTILSTGGAAGLQDGDTITFQIGASPVTMTARAAPALATEFRVWTTLGTVQANLEYTAEYFCAAFNARCFATGVGMRAYPVGLPTSQGGVIMVEALRVDPTASGLQFVTSRSTWYQADQSGAGLNFGYGNEARNAIAYSKSRRGDAVPYVNRLTVGPSNARILRTQPFRDRQYVFTDAGTYVITGRSFADFSVQPYALDLTLFGRENICVCDDAVYAWCTVGLVRLTDGGWDVISTPIEPTIQNLLNDAKAGNGIAELGFAVGDTQQHRVLFWYPSADAQGNAGNVNGCSRALCFDTRTQAWSQYALTLNTSGGWPDNRTHGAVRFSDKRVVLTSERDNNTSEGWLFEENMSLISADYLDDYSMGVVGFPFQSPVSAYLQLQFQTPNPEGAEHWQQTVLQFDAGEQAWRPLPAAVTVGWYTETQSAGVGPISPSTKVLRLEPPKVVRRANQLSVKVGDNAIGYFGLVGLWQRYASQTPFARTSR